MHTFGLQLQYKEGQKYENPGFFRHVCALLSVFVVWQVVSIIPLSFLVSILVRQNVLSSDSYTVASNELMIRLNNVEPVLTFFALQVSFLIALCGVFFFYKLYYNRPLKTLITGHTIIAWKKIRYTCMLFAGIAMVQVGIFFTLHPEAYSYNERFTIPFYLWFIPVSVFTIFAQVLFEEVFFRGFLYQVCSQKLGKWVGSILVVFVFGLLHFVNPENSISPWVSANYIVLSLVWMIMVHISNSIELSIVHHLVNNIFSILLISVKNGVVPAVGIVVWQNPVYGPLEFSIACAGYLLSMLLGWWVYKRN